MAFSIFLYPRSPLSRIHIISRFCASQAKHVTLWSILTNGIYEYLVLDGGEEHGDEISVYQIRQRHYNTRIFSLIAFINIDAKIINILQSKTKYI